MFEVKLLTTEATIPTRASDQAAGYDLFSAYDYTLNGHSKVLVKTDIAVKIPDFHYGRIAPRSSLAWKNSIDVGAGVIDSDYRGNIGVILFNHCPEIYSIKKGERIAQLILTRISTPEIVKVDYLSDTSRGEGGFGSTGK